MGQQQLLLIILGVIIVGIAIAVGLSLFSAQSIQSNKDAMINDLNNIAAQAYQYKVRPASMGGGQGSYSNFSIPTKMATNENATYVASNAGATSVQIDATSNQNSSNLITVIV
ncbi:MAG: hypothetical protein WBD36_05605, partial [Bacteroidota bacterium]